MEERSQGPPSPPPRGFMQTFSAACILYGVVRPTIILPKSDIYIYSASSLPYEVVDCPYHHGVSSQNICVNCTDFVSFQAISFKSLTPVKFAFELWKHHNSEGLHGHGVSTNASAKVRRPAARWRLRIGTCSEASLPRSRKRKRSRREGSRSKSKSKASHVALSSPRESVTSF